jgi:anti-sigma B factor antagonist
VSEDPQILVLSTRSESGHTVIAVRGELDLSGKPQLDAQLAQALSAPGSDALIIDLSELRFIDSSGIHSLIVARRESARQNRPMVVVRGGSAVMRVLSLCGVESRITVADDLPAAMQLAGTPAGQGADTTRAAAA